MARWLGCLGAINRRFFLRGLIAKSRDCFFLTSPPRVLISAPRGRFIGLSIVWLKRAKKFWLWWSRPFGATSRDFQEFPLSVVPLLDCGFPIFIAHQDSASLRFILFAFAPIT